MAGGYSIVPIAPPSWLGREGGRGCCCQPPPTSQSAGWVRAAAVYVLFCVLVFVCCCLCWCLWSVFVMCHGPHLGSQQRLGGTGEGFDPLALKTNLCSPPCVVTSVPTVPRVSPGASCPPLLPVPPQGSHVQSPSLSPLSPFSPLSLSALTFPQFHLSPGARRPSQACPWAGLCSQESSRSLRAVDCPGLGIPEPLEPTRVPREPQGPAGTRRDALFQLGLCLC
ncbi:hypothetical protein Nmel_018795 [Mimus melanotis]